MNNTLARAIPAATLALFAGVASAQVEVIYAASTHSPLGLRTAVPNLTGETFKNFYFPYHSASGSRWVVQFSVNSATSADQADMVGFGMTGVTVAREGTYADAYSPLYVLGVLNNPAVDSSGNWIQLVTASGLAFSGDHIIRGTLAPAGTTVPQSVAAQAGGTASDGAVYVNFNSSTLTTAGPAFQATVSGAPYTAGGFINNTPVVKVGITVPTNQGGGTTAAWSAIDRDFFLVDATGTHTLVSGTIGAPGSPRTLAYDGVVVAEVGYPLAGMPGTVSTIGSTTSNRCYLDPAGDWYATGTNSDGASWAVKNGVKVARKGEPIHVGTSEIWNAVQDVKGNAHGDYVVLGTTSAAAPNDQVMVVNNKAVIVRKSDGVDLDGDHVNDPNLYIHTASVGRMIPNDDGFLYFSTMMKLNATDTTNTLGTNNSFVRLPMCPADMGMQGGIPGTDGLFDNNDFVVFISNFFTANPRADIGTQGGVAGRDGLFDNNDFVVFIDLFFTACR